MATIHAQRVCDNLRTLRHSTIDYCSHACGGEWNAKQLRVHKLADSQRASDYLHDAKLPA